jgi:hypothetical protein
MVSLLESSMAELQQFASSQDAAPYSNQTLRQLIEMPPIADLQDDSVPGWDALVEAIRSLMFLDAGENS